jgi:hypothetical protein
VRREDERRDERREREAQISDFTFHDQNNQKHMPLCLKRKHSPTPSPAK